MERYSEYKDSGVQWLGEIPSHWKMKRCKYLLKIQTNSSKRPIKIGLENIEGFSGRYLPTDTIFDGDGVDFAEGDIVYGKLRPYLCKVWLAEFAGNAVGDFYVYKTSDDYYNCYAYAKVWGERAKDKSQYLSQLHTDYYNKVGHKYGLARGFSYDELSEEEKRGRKHKNKMVLEAERQAKEALDKVKGYTVLATIDKKELTIPFLNIKAPVQEAMNAVKKELAIPIPTIIGQKVWREERVTNINAAIKALVVAIEAERDKQNEGVRSSVNKTYTYYMQNLNKQIEENKSLRAENDALRAENNKIKQRISQLDEKAVERVNTQLVCAKEELAISKSYNTTLLEMYNDLKARWNAIWLDPEMTDAWRRVEARKEREAKEKALQEAEAKRESQARQSRYLGVLDKFIHEGHEALSSFAKTDRVNFNEKESASIYYSIMASAVKHNIGLDSKVSIESAMKRFLSDMSWHSFTDFKQECVTSWTKLFATNEVQFTDNAIDNFLAFVDHMSCSADTYVSLGGSNGCADQLTNWDGTQKIGLGTVQRKKTRGLSV